MALSKENGVNDAIEQYKENLDWEGNPTKARLALQALKLLAIERPSSMSLQGRQVTWADLLSEKTRLEKYVDNVVNTNRTRFVVGRMLRHRRA